MAKTQRKPSDYPSFKASQEADQLEAAIDANGLNNEQLDETWSVFVDYGLKSAMKHIDSYKSAARLIAEQTMPELYGVKK